MTGGHDLAEAMAPNTTLPITDEARQIFRAIRGKAGSGDVIHFRRAHSGPGGPKGRPLQRSAPDRPLQSNLTLTQFAYKLRRYA